MYMETEHLIIRDYSMAYVWAYFMLKSNPQIMYYLPGIKLSTIEETEKVLIDLMEDQRSDNRKFYFFHIELKSTRETVGSIGYTVIQNADKEKSVGAGYFIYPHFWANGYTTEALERVLEYAFLEKGVTLVEAECFAENKGSERVMQKCGMHKDEEYVEYELHDGEKKLRLRYQLSKSEWVNGNRNPAR